MKLTGVVFILVTISNVVIQIGPALRTNTWRNSHFQLVVDGKKLCDEDGDFQSLSPLACPLSRSSSEARSAFADPRSHPRFKAILARFMALLKAGGQYMVSVSGCKDVNPTEPTLVAILKPYLEQANLKGLKVRDCSYTKDGLTGRVIMLNVDADQLARWTISACHATQQGTTDQCLTAVMNDMWCSSNAQFPVSGTVVEDASNCGQGSGSALIAFHDGVTVRIKSFRPQSKGATCVKRQLTKDELAAVLTEPALGSGQFGRIANANPNDLLSMGLAQNQVVRHPVSGKNIPYLETIRSAYFDAIGNDNYPLLSAWATNREKTGCFDKFKNVSLGKISNTIFYSDDKCK